MCGVVAVASPGGTLPDPPTLDRARDSLGHRGPDHATSEYVDGWIALAHRRLAIIDLAGANQPLRSEDGQIVLIFNGEIYNFTDLRTRLVDLGHTFATAGDGEVIVHGYEQWGDRIFAMLEGMFAIILVDRVRRRALFARDRFGIKPLFYTRYMRGIAAASELKALLALGVARTASRSALELGALRMHVPWPYTALDGVFRLPPGSLLELQEDGELRIVRFAMMMDEPAVSPPAATPEAAFDQLRAAVSRQMVADVPVGAFLSGGIDSTLIVALMRGLTSAPVHTFSIRTREQDESTVAEATAASLGTTHHTIFLEDIDFEQLTELPALYDEPFAETSALGVRALSRFAREHVKVALSGDGGDEVFGGYGSYRWIRSLGVVPVPRRDLIGRRVHSLLVRRAWPPPIRRMLRAALLAGNAPETAQRDATTLAWASSAMVRGDSEALSERIVAASGIHPDRLDFARRAMLADRLERLPNAMLTKVDIASMSASLEVRVPMLDDALVRYADSLPISELVGWRWNKKLLRRVLARTPAANLAWEKKRGFTLPLDRWMESASIAARLDELFGDHRRTLIDLTGDDVSEPWRAFRDRSSRFSQGTAAMQLLWFASVALWADRLGVRTAEQRSLPRFAIV